jgi:ferredoxin
MTTTVSPAMTRALAALADRRYFKLICGASFRDGPMVEAMTSWYGAAGAHAVDIGPHPTLLPAVRAGLATLPPDAVAPLVMVSFDLDGDPHFRHVVVDEPTCIVCSACVPVCPTVALAIGPSVLPESGGAETLRVDDPLCYGCGRCVEVCPVDAFAYKALDQLAQPLIDMLADPVVEAVELHTHGLQVADLQTFWHHSGGRLAGKVVSVCFRPQQHEPPAIAGYLQALDQLARDTGVAAVMLQVDGQPMSGSDDRGASVPALQAAQALLASGMCPPQWPVTVSGGINAHTANRLRQPEFAGIAGVGMGTMARQAVWPYKDQPARARVAAMTMVEQFTA